MPKIIFTLALPPSPFANHPDYPVARKVPGATTASERLPLCLVGFPDIPAVYRFTIYIGPSVQRFYVGETIHFASRMEQYCGMIRRLLLLHQGVPNVVLEKHPMRHVQYFLASALLQVDARIELEWNWLSTALSKKQREALERAEQQRFQVVHSKAILIAGHASGNFETHPPHPLSPHWTKAHDRIGTCPSRRGRPPPFVV